MRTNVSAREYDVWMEQLLDPRLTEMKICAHIGLVDPRPGAYDDPRFLETLLTLMANGNRLDFELMAVEQGQALMRAGHQVNPGVTMMNQPLTDDELLIVKRRRQEIQAITNAADQAFVHGLRVSTGDKHHQRWQLARLEMQLKLAVEYFTVAKHDSEDRNHHRGLAGNLLQFTLTWAPDALEWMPWLYKLSHRFSWEDELWAWCEGGDAKTKERQAAYWQANKDHVFSHCDDNVEAKREHLAARICKFGIESHQDLIGHYVELRARFVHERTELRHEFERVSNSTRLRAIKRRLEEIEYQLNLIPLP